MPGAVARAQARRLLPRVSASAAGGQPARSAPEAAAKPRLATPPGHRFPWPVRLILALQRRKYGRELESARLWGRMPSTFLMLTLLYRTLDRARSPLEPGLRALVQVRVSQINGCGFCMDLNGAAALERAVAPAKLAALGQYAASSLYTAREKAALAFAESLTDPARGVDDACFVRLRQHFDEPEVLELTALAAFQNLSSKFNAALDVAPQGFCMPAGEDDVGRGSAGEAGSPQCRDAGKPVPGEPGEGR